MRLKEEAAQSHINGIYIEDEKYGREFQTLFNSLPDPVVIVDSKGKFLAVNKKVEEKTGFKEEELIGKNFMNTKIVTMKSKAILIKNLMKRMMGANIGTYEIDALTKDGEKIPSEVNAAKIEYDGKKADLVIFRDITERRKSEEALKESEEKFRNLAEQSPNMIFVNKNGRILYANKKCENTIGYKREQFYSPHFDFSVLIDPDFKKIVHENFEKHKMGKDVAPYEYRLVTKDGKHLNAIIATKLVKWGGENAILGTVTDITEQKKLEEKLKQYSEHLEDLVNKRTEELLESEKRYSVLVEEASDGVTITQDQKIVFANKKASEITGYSRNELIGISYGELMEEKYLDRVKEICSEKMRGKEFTSELEFISKTGELVPVEVSGTHIDYQGRPAVLTILRDIRERKRVEQEHIRLEKLAAVGELATMVGHDLRNPLQSIENALYYLVKELHQLSQSVTIPKKTMEMLSVIQSSVNYADNIIRDLQDFSATRKPSLKKANINTIVKETLSQVEKPRNVKISTKLSQLPEVEVDKDMIKRVFLNLISNGIHATTERQGKLEIKTNRSNKFVEVSFADNGEGITEENKKKLFTPFFSTRAKGMGMGLPICKKFVESHGGTIEVKSEEGKGSIFTVKLPIQQKSGGEIPDQA